MLAAPKHYSFGTKIYLEGLGIGTVDDRGGAIVGSGSRGYDADRLDIWMGQGEEGLRRALSWGKRRVSGKILGEDEEVSQNVIDLSRVPIMKISPATYKKQQDLKNADIVEVESIFSHTINKKSDPEKIKELQTILSRLSYYTGEIDGKYSQAIEDALYDFQIENQIIISKKNYGAGFYGIKTRTKLKEIYALYVANEKKRMEEAARLALEKAEETKRLAAQKREVTLFIQNLGTPKADEVGTHVRALQQTLASLGYFKGKDTAIFGKNTRAALTQYQKERNI
jgi:peptidoglycan hydrolase-like protein with peptidoglycan-binding domain